MDSHFPGHAIEVAVVYDYDIERKVELPHRSISHWEVQSEGTWLDGAWEQSSEDLKHVDRNASRELRFAEAARVLSAYSAMAKDIALLVKQHIGSELVNVEQTLDFVICEFAARFTRLDSTYSRGREQDIRNVGRRRARHLADFPPWTNQPLPPGSVIVARELLPSETLELARSGAVAYGNCSHYCVPQECVPEEP